MKVGGFAPRNQGTAHPLSKLTPKGKQAPQKPRPAIMFTRTLPQHGVDSNDIAKSFGLALKKHNQDKTLNLYL